MIIIITITSDNFRLPFAIPNAINNKKESEGQKTVQKHGYAVQKHLVPELGEDLLKSETQSCGSQVGYAWGPHPEYEVESETGHRWSPGTTRSLISLQGSLS